MFAQAAATAAALGGAVLAGQTQVASAETLYDKVSKLAAAVDALEKKAGGVGGVSTADLKCAHLEMLSIVLVVDSGSPGCVAASQHASRPVRTRRRRALAWSSRGAFASAHPRRRHLLMSGLLPGVLRREVVDLTAANIAADTLALAKMGDIGLMGAPAKKDGKAVEGVRIFLGG